MADPIEWYATDDSFGGAALAVTPTMESPFPDVAIYAHAPGLPSPVVWTPIWEPLSSGTAPQTFPDGPLAVGQAPSVPTSSGTPATYSPSDSDAVGVINFWDLGILRLRATADGAPVPGELVMAISAGAGMYPNIAIYYEPGAASEIFWVQHQATYEIP